MFADLGFPLTREYVRDAPVSVLRRAVKSWMESTNPTCLLHPHGFYIVLLGRNETQEWRFHYWPPGSPNTLGMPARIHTHDRHVESRILQGTLTDIQYQVATTTAGGQPLYEVLYEGDRYSQTTSNILRRTATRVISTVKQSTSMQSGETYQIECHAYHEAVVPQHVATSTLVCMHGHLPGSVNVIGLDGYPEIISFQRTEHRADVFAGHLLF